MVKSRRFIKFTGVFFVFVTIMVISSACLSQNTADSLKGNVLGPFNSAADAIRAFKGAAPGDHIVITDGVYKDFDGNFGSRNGTRSRNIFIRAETPGGVTLTGKSRIHISNSSCITIRDFIFKDGFYAAGTSGAAILVSGDSSSYVRITNILMDGYHSPVPEDDCRWVRVYGKYNEVDNSTFINKRSRGVTVEICRSNTEPNFAKVHHNYFGFTKPVLDSDGREMNGLETVRIGTSERSQDDASSVVEYNYFEECDGEIEIISNKSCKNIYRGNVFLNNNGTLTLRHGNFCIVEDNIFINTNKNGMGGVRVMDKGHVIRNNYFENLGQNRRSAISLEYAVPNSPLNRYWPVTGTLIEKNSFINSRMAISTGPTGGISSDQSIPPSGTRAAGNLIVTNSDTLQITYRANSDPAIAFSNNLAYGSNLQLSGYGVTPALRSGDINGIRIANPQMNRNEDNLLMPGAGFTEYGMQPPKGRHMLKRGETGASFAKEGAAPGGVQR